MNDWLRSVTVLGLGFGIVVFVTLELAILIVPGPGGSSQPTGSGGPEATAFAGEAEDASGIPGLGGTLEVTGDREGIFRLTRESIEERYSLEGDEGRIVFEGRPVEAAQISYDGLEFFPDPGDCTIAAGNLDNMVGIGLAELQCDDLVDIRGNGVITLSGTIGLPIDLLGARNLPASGGSVEVGGETWQFADGFLFTWQMGNAASSPHALELVDAARGTALNFRYDLQTHRLTLVSVERDGTEATVADTACELGRTELGRVNPRTTVIELTIQCAAVEVPGLGPVQIQGSVIVDELQF
jgi:hypothetical protein